MYHVVVLLLDVLSFSYSNSLHRKHERQEDCAKSITEFTISYSLVIHQCCK